MAYGADRGLALTDKLVDEPALAGYAQLPAVRGEGERALFTARATGLSATSSPRRPSVTTTCRNRRDT